MCGEQMTISGAKAAILGSPPRVRGTVWSWTRPAAKFRITPACAGNRVKNRTFIGINPDHPRVCGEQRQLCVLALVKVGSPPRVRGTGAVVDARIHGLGITPACAGNRLYGWAWTCRAKYHPRVCGEQAAAAEEIVSGEGSPPRVRGTDTIHGASSLPWRITPACAGNSSRYGRLGRA